MYGDPMSTGPTVEQLKQTYPDVADYVLHKLPDLYTRCAAHFGPALDVAEIIRRYTQASRVRFVGGGGAAGCFDADELDAIVHAAEHGYELCFKRMGYDSYCWLPHGHVGECVRDNFFLWKLLFGQPVSGVAVMETARARQEFSSEREYRLPGLGDRALPITRTADASSRRAGATEVREVSTERVGDLPRDRSHATAGEGTPAREVRGRIVLCMERYEAEVLEKPEGLRVEVIPWGRLAEDPETDPGTMDLLNETLEAGDFDCALELVRALTEASDEGGDEDPQTWLGPRY